MLLSARITILYTGLSLSLGRLFFPSRILEFRPCLSSTLQVARGAVQLDDLNFAGYDQADDIG